MLCAAAADLEAPEPIVVWELLLLSSRPFDSSGCELRYPVADLVEELWRCSLDCVQSRDHSGEVEHHDDEHYVWVGAMTTRMGGRSRVQPLSVSAETTPEGLRRPRKSTHTR